MKRLKQGPMEQFRRRKYKTSEMEQLKRRRRYNQRYHMTLKEGSGRKRIRGNS
jgi:hypothetical protein